MAKNFTYSLLILLLFSFFYSCHNKNQNSKIEKHYILYSGRGSGVDTLNYELVNKRPPGTTDHNVIDSFDFKYNGRYINIKKVTNYPNGPIDGGYVSYWEKSIGYFYERSTTWRNFLVLKTNSDSINDLVKVLLGTVLLDPQMAANPGIDYKEYINFKTPNVQDTVK